MEQQPLETLFPNIAVQMRTLLSNLHLAASQLAPAGDREADPDLDAKAARVDRSYYQLLRMVNDLNAVAYLQTAADRPGQNWDVVEIVSTLCEESASLARMIGLELRFVCPMEGHRCAVDRRALELIVFQLLSNAFKFTPAGGTVTVELKRGEGHLRLSVADTGRGIEPERLPHLFDRFLQPDQMDPQPHGLGLGLTLCRRMATALGGSIVAESHLGAGSRFTVSIPDQLAEGGEVSDVPVDYTGGFNRTLLALADALPAEAFLVRNQD